MIDDIKNYILSLFFLILLASCSSGINAIEDAHDAYRIFSSIDSSIATSIQPDNIPSTNQVVITGLNPGDPKAPKGWGALVISIDGIKVNGTGDIATILPGQHILEIKCYTPGADIIRNKITKTFETNKKYIISASHDGNSCNIFTLDNNA